MPASFGTVRDDLQALIDHAGSGSRLFPVPVAPAELSLRALELARLSPLAEWHYKTAHKDSFVSIEREGRQCQQRAGQPLTGFVSVCSERNAAPSP